MSNNQYTELSIGSGGSLLDESGITYPDAPVLRRRTRIVLAGESLEELVQVKNVNLDGAEYGLVVRNLPSHPTDTIVSFDQNAAVSSNVETIIVSFSVPSDKTFCLTGVIAQGDLPGRFRIYVDASCKLSFRTVTSNPTMQQCFPSPPFTASTGQIVSIKVAHYISGVTGDFEGSILGFLI